MSQAQSHNAVFETARDRFLRSLSLSEKAIFSRCSSAESLIADVAKSGQAGKDRLWAKRILSSVSRFGASLKPYFDTIGIFVQSHPEYAAIIWGAFHLVFKLAENYTSFFTKLAKTLDRITDLLPHYDAIARLGGKGPSDDLQNSLCQVYEDLLSFVYSVLSVFRKEDGKAKRSIRVATGLLWKPFDVRFEDILENFRYHRDLVDSKLLLAQLLETKESKVQIGSQIEALKEALRKRERHIATRDSQSLGSQALNDIKKNILDQKVAGIKFWIKCPNFDQPYERALDQKEPGTAEWLFSQTTTLNWLNSKCETPHDTKRRKFNQRAFWVQGNPGCGKTILAASTIAELKAAHTTGSPTPEVYYFFFRDGVPEFQDPSGPLRAFLAQMFHTKRNDEDVIDRFSFIMEETSSGSPAASRSALLELLQLCIGESESVIFIIDALDECEDPESVNKDLLALINGTNDAKILLFSRPNVSALFKTIPDQQRLNIGDLNRADIELYVRAQLDEMDEEEMLTANSDISELGSRLVLGASGMFLWIRLMITYLNSPALTRRQRIDAIMRITTPEGLEQMYDRITLLIQGKNTAERNLAVRIFVWLLNSRRPLTTRELQVSISEDDSLQPGDEDDYVDFKRSVIMSCAGLVEVQSTPSETFAANIDSFQFIHLSAKEYIMQQGIGHSGISSHDNRSLAPITTDHGANLTQIANRCLAVLAYRLPAHPLIGSSGYDLTPTELHSMFPLVGYAACYWIDHVIDALRYNRNAIKLSTAILPSLAKFLSLKRPLMAWIQASYVLQRIPAANSIEEIPRAISSLRVDEDVAKDLLPRLVADTTELARYVRVLDKDWGRQLLLSPKDVWEEITAFTPSRLIEGTRHTQVHALIMDPPRVQSISSRYLSKISELSEDGKTVAILSIWPSKAFEQCAQSSMKPIESMLHTVCRDWVARYELWSVTDEPRCIADGSIPLDPDEVHLQVQHSMWQNDPTFRDGHWKMQFPAAISPDTRLICIIRTVYLFSVTKHNEAIMHAVVLPLHTEDGLDTVWKGTPETRESSDNSTTTTDAQKSSSGSFKSSLSGFLKPFSSHKRSKSMTRETENPPLSISNLRVPQSTFRSLSRSLSQRNTRSESSDPSMYDRIGTYRHSVAFAQHGAYLLFMDQLPKAPYAADYPPNTVILFQLDIRAKLMVAKVRSVKTPIYPNGELPPFKVVLHPNAGALALFFPRVNDSQVTLWHWSTQDRFEDIDVLGEMVEGVHFSQDGDYLVIQTNTSTAPRVVPISVPYSGPTGHVEDLAIHSRALAKEPSSAHAIYFPENLSSGVFKSRTIVSETGKTSGLTLFQSGTEVAIRKWSNSDESSSQDAKDEVLQLTRLPGTMSAGSAAIITPLLGADKVHVVINKNAQQWDDMVQDVDVNLPALVSRDIGNLKIEDSSGSSKRLEDASRFAISS